MSPCDCWICQEGSCQEFHYINFIKSKWGFTAFCVTPGARKKKNQWMQVGVKVSTSSITGIVEHVFHLTKWLLSLQAGGCAGMCVDLTLFPLDTIKTRLQSQQGFYKAGGFRGIYAGVPSAAVGSFPNGTTLIMMVGSVVWWRFTVQYCLFGATKPLKFFCVWRHSERFFLSWLFRPNFNCCSLIYFCFLSGLKSGTVIMSKSAALWTFVGCTDQFSSSQTNELHFFTLFCSRAGTHMHPH